ncbi:MAG: SlyX family protein [Gammaproteobacteria bacterium]|nr:SlyX family protein [Gammaproteobacteria bacterium]
MNDDIIELQTRLAFQEDTITELSDILARQQVELERMQSNIDLLQQQIQHMIQGTLAEESSPPHY